MKELTKKQQEVLNFIKYYIKEKNYCPSYREMCDYFNVTLGAIQTVIIALEKKEYIRREKGYRAMRILK